MEGKTGRRRTLNTNISLENPQKNPPKKNSPIKFEFRSIFALLGSFSLCHGASNQHQLSASSHCLKIHAKTRFEMENQQRYSHYCWRWIQRPIMYQPQEGKSEREKKNGGMAGILYPLQRMKWNPEIERTESSEQMEEANFLPQPL